MGLLVSPLWPSASALPQTSALLVLVTVAGLSRGRAGAGATAAIIASALILGMTLGAARLDAISDGALEAVPGSRASVEGFVLSQPSHSRGLTRLVVRSDAGRLMVESPDPADGVETGSGIKAAGKLTPAPGWLAGQLRRQGVSMVLHAARIDPTGTSRGGPAGWVDRMRRRGEEALGRGMPEREAALARGFVLGQDDSIDEATTEDFQRSGLAHLLRGYALGQNVTGRIIDPTNRLAQGSASDVQPCPMPRFTVIRRRCSLPKAGSDP